LRSGDDDGEGAGGDSGQCALGHLHSRRLRQRRQLEVGSRLFGNNPVVAVFVDDDRAAAAATSDAPDPEGQQAELLREWNGNLVTNYRFSTGRAKGINLGGNIQYRGSAVIGSLVNPTTNLPDFANPLKGTGYTIVGVHVRYERRVFGKYDWNVSLHVRNLLDEDRLIEKSASATVPGGCGSAGSPTKPSTRASAIRALNHQSTYR
jgi:hypothetical protein